MGVSLTYETSHPVSDTIRRAVEAEAASLTAARRWWCEGLIFFRSPESPLLGLAGDTKLFRSCYETATGEIVEIDEQDDSFMAWRDAVYIASVLARWSLAYDLTWRLLVLGNEVGRITPEGIGDDVHGYLDDLSRISGGPTLPAEAVERHAAAIYTKYEPGSA